MSSWLSRGSLPREIYVRTCPPRRVSSPFSATSFGLESEFLINPRNHRARERKNRPDALARNSTGRRCLTCVPRIITVEVAFNQPRARALSFSPPSSPFDGNAMQKVTVTWAVVEPHIRRRTDVKDTGSRLIRMEKNRKRDTQQPSNHGLLPPSFSPSFSFFFFYLIHRIRMFCRRIPGTRYSRYRIPRV